MSKYDYTPEQEAAALALLNGGANGEKKDYSDPRQFKPAIKDPKKANDKRPDQYQALVRILPRGMDKSKPFCQEVQEHFYSENGQTLSKTCRKTFGPKEVCPICDAAWKLYNIGKDNHDEQLMKVAKKRLPKAHYWMNIYVIQDAINPANNGKVMLWKVTNNMYEIIVSAMKKKEPKTTGLFNQTGAPELAPFYPYHVINSYPLLVDLVRDTKTGFPSYEGSSWYNTAAGFSPLARTEQEIDAILAQCNDLTEFTANILDVESMTQELLKFQARVNQAAVAESAGGFGNVVAPPPNMAQPVQGNSQAFFGTPAQQPPLGQPVPFSVPGFNTPAGFSQPTQAPTVPFVAPVAPVAPVGFPQTQSPVQAAPAPVMQAPAPTAFPTNATLPKDEDDLPF